MGRPGTDRPGGAEPIPSVTIELIGVPQGKGRPRFTARGSFGRAYTPAKTRAYETALAWQAKVAMRGRQPLEGPLVVLIWACMPIPRSWSRRRQDAALAGTIRPTVKPDWDNLAKVTDALNGIVWTDDASVVDGRVVKVYGEQPLIRVEVSELTIPLEETDDSQTDSLRRGLQSNSRMRSR